MLRTESFGSVVVTSVDRAAVFARAAELGASLRAEHPEVESVSVFGSYAKGNYLPESDLDLLIVVSETGRAPLFRADPYRLHFADMPMDVNLLVATRVEVERVKEGDGGVLSAALREGVRLTPALESRRTSAGG
jgi:predicted nucleotidyltransferase